MSISVALCTYNGENHVEAQLASILAQTVLPDEIVIADDGSSDSTLELVNSISQSSPVPVRILSPLERPMGVRENFSRALRSTTSEWIFLSDQDDLWHENKIETTMRLVAANPSVQVIAHDLRLVGQNGVIASSYFRRLGLPANHRQQRIAVVSFEHVVRRSDFAGMSMAVSRELLDRALPIPAPWPHDYWISLVAASTSSFYTTNAVLADYRQHDRNVIGAGSKSFLHRLRRLLKVGSDSHKLARMFRELDLLLPGMSTKTPVPNYVGVMVTRKSRFEQRRADMPASALRRAWIVLKLLTSGEYRHLASNREMNALRDLLHPPGMEHE